MQVARVALTCVILSSAKRKFSKSTMSKINRSQLKVLYQKVLLPWLHGCLWESAYVFDVCFGA